MFIKNIHSMNQLGGAIADKLQGGDTIELIGDVGAGKTTLTQSIAKRLGVDEPIQSPTFTIQRQYQARDGLRLVHYDFYRLGDAGIMAQELEEVTADPQTITIIEWADTVESVLPSKRIILSIAAHKDSEEARTISYRLEGDWSSDGRFEDVFTA